MGRLLPLRTFTFLPPRKPLCVRTLLLAVSAGVFLSLAIGAAAQVVQTAAPAGGVRVEASGPDGVRFAVSDLEPSWSEVSLRGGTVTRYDVSIDGFIIAGEAGGFRVPGTGGWVVVPPGTRPVLKVVQEQWQPVASLPLMVESVPVIIPGAESWENSATEILVLPGEDPPADAEIPEHARRALLRRGAVGNTQAVSLGNVSWWRGRRVVSYRVVPVRYDGQGRATGVLESGTWEIAFVADRAAGAGIPRVQARKRSTANDDRFAGAFLNGALLKQMPAEAAWLGVDPFDVSGGEKARGGKSGTLLGPEARLTVTRTGLTRVTYDRLQSRGLLPAGPIAEDQIRLYQRRYLPRLDDGSGNPPYVDIEVPIHLVGEGDAFDGDDFFIFYGLRLRDDVDFLADVGAGPETIPGSGDTREMDNQGNIYWLAASEPEPTVPWARMQTIGLPAAAGTPLDSYRRTDHWEEQLAFRENLPTVAADRLFYNTLLATEANAGIDVLWAPDPAGSEVNLDVGIAGYNFLTRNLRLSLITDAADTTVLEDYDLSSILEVERNYVLPPAAIAGNFSKVRIVSTALVKNLFSFLNWARLSYDALYQATGNRVEFNTGNGTGPRPIAVTGFTSADIGLVEITDPRNPVLVALQPANVAADGGTWTLSVMPDQAGATRVFAAEGDFSTDGVGEFPSFLAEVAADPVNPTELVGGNPDLIVIAHKEFIGALDPWIEHRKRRAGGDLEVHVVDVEDLYDWYNGGLRSAWALKRFTTHAITRWGSWALVTVGDANENALEKKVLPAARAWAKDWVPTHYHVQKALSFEPELMASDKWYATLESGTNYPEDNYPDDVFAPYEMYTGRFPCNSVAELNIMVEKVMTVENVQAGQEWRKRNIIFADDRWSNGYGAEALSTLTYKSGERVFTQSGRDSLAALWRSGSPVTLEADTLFLENWLDPLYPYDPPPPQPAARPINAVRNDTEDVATTPLLNALSAGGLVSVYQGHANPYVLSSEYWLEDRDNQVSRQDVAKLNNLDKPWLFIGLGCHISDWAQNVHRTESVANERSVAEKFLIRSRAGASAAYGSSGYEYITENRIFGEYLFRRLMRNPPSFRTVGGGGEMRSRWVVGELLHAAESDLWAVIKAETVKELIAQYVLLGDPLMTLDAGEPQVTAALASAPTQEISGEVEITAADASNIVTVNLTARDEAGIDRVQVIGSDGTDLTGGIVTETLPPGATNHQTVAYSLAIPVRPFDHSVAVRVYDTGGALASDRHYELVLNMPQTASFSTGGAVIDPTTFVFPADEAVTFSSTVSSAAWMLGYDPGVNGEGGDFALTSVDGTLALADIAFNLDKANEQLTVDFTATAAAEDPNVRHAVLLTIAGFATEFVLQEGPQAGTVAGIGRVYNFPNPMQDNTRFVFESGTATGEGVIRVFSVAGRTVAQLAFRYDGNGTGVVEWDGRDGVGDELGNGTYLYRVEMDTAQGRAVSDMQRLVMMR